MYILDICVCKKIVVYFPGRTIWPGPRIRTKISFFFEKMMQVYLLPPIQLK